MSDGRKSVLGASAVAVIPEESDGNEVQAVKIGAASSEVDKETKEVN